MRKIPATFGLVLLLLVTLFHNPSHAQNQTPASIKTNDSVVLKNGDRVVFLGNSIFENDFQYGYLELALTTRFHNFDLTFRNLGWSGDNVWGDGRSTFTKPPTAYQHLMRNIADAKPTVVFLGYGGVEAQDGEAGLARFKDGLSNLLNKFDSLGAKTILLSTIPVVTNDTAIDVSKRNADLELYTAAIAKIASERGKLFIDVFKPISDISKKENIIENGVHLNELGYYHLSNILIKGLGLKSDKEIAVLSVSKQGAITSSANAKIIEAGKDAGNFTFTVSESYLPVLPPRLSGSEALNAPVLKVSGLKKGVYTLTANDMQVAVASAKDWEKGVEIRQGPSFLQVADIRDMIFRKNELHFFQYRPMNETYIIGFRAYEQGKHVKDLEDQNILIKWQESLINLKKAPKEILYKLSAVSN